MTRPYSISDPSRLHQLFSWMYTEPEESYPRPKTLPREVLSFVRFSWSIFDETENTEPKWNEFDDSTRVRVGLSSIFRIWGGVTFLKVFFLSLQNFDGIAKTWN